jgi:transglutaminase-like putative cysteine protease
MTDALAALGVMALVASGQFNRGVNVAITICLFMAIAMRESWRHEAANKHVDTIAVFALVTVQLGRAIFTSASILDLLIEFAVGLQIIRVATRKGAAHDQQVIVLALLHLIAGTVVGGGLGYGLCFFGLLVVTPGALVLSHLRREVEGNYRQGARDRTGLPVDVPRILRSKRVVGRQFIAVTCLLSVPILLFTVSLFVIFPRVGLSLLLLNRPKSGRMIGFSGKVDLGQIGTLRTDPTIALRVTMSDLPEPPPPRKVMHLRGTALDHYDGRSWTQSHKVNRLIASGGEMVTISAVPNVRADPLMRVELEPIDPPVLFLPPTAKGLRLSRGNAVGPGSSVSVHRGPEGELRYQAPNDRGIHYQVFLSSDRAAAFQHLRASERPRYLQLPADLPERIRELAARWTENKKTDYDKARAIERHLRTQYSYDLSSPSGKYDQPLDHFLFESKRGHCEYYSTAMAVMLRTLDVPSRNATGFIGGTWNQFGKFYAVRQGDAHSWVEVFIEGRGWLTFDPTPPGAAEPQSDIDGVLATVRDFFEAVSQRWNRHVLGYDLHQQVSLFESLSSKHRSTFDTLRKPSTRTLLLAAGLMVVLVSLYILYRRRKRRTDLGPESHRGSKEAVLATNLYQLLDRTMLAMGVARSSATPPYRHARRLVHAGHPQGSEILELTERYLDARFGERPIELDDRRDFEQRVRKLRDAPRSPLLTLVDPDAPFLEPALAPASAASRSGAEEGAPTSGERASGEVRSARPRSPNAEDAAADAAEDAAEGAAEGAAEDAAEDAGEAAAEPEAEEAADTGAKKSDPPRSDG